MDSARLRRAGERRGMLMVMAAAALWGTGGIAGQYLYDSSDVEPITVGFYRLAVAACVLTIFRLAFSKSRERLSPSGGGLLRIFAVGAGLAAFQACFFVAVRAVGVSVATLVTLGLAPVLVTLGAAVFFGERAGGRVLVALAAALSGLALLVGQPSGSGAGSGMLLGTAFAVGSALGYAVVTLVSRTLAARVDPFRLTLFGFAVGAAVLLPLAANAGLAVEATPASLGVFLYLGVVPTAVAYGLFFAGLRTTRPSVASILTLVEPLTASVLAAIIFGERLGAAGLAGGALLLSAVVVLYARRGGG